MARRTIKEGEHMDPIQVGDIITLELKDGSIISELLAVPAEGDVCKICYMFQNRQEHTYCCFEGWEVRNPEKYGSDFKDMALCCTKPVLTRDDDQQPEFCRFVKLDTIMENL